MDAPSGVTSEDDPSYGAMSGAGGVAVARTKSHGHGLDMGAQERAAELGVDEHKVREAGQARRHDELRGAAQESLDERIYRALRGASGLSAAYPNFVDSFAQLGGMDLSDGLEYPWNSRPGVGSDLYRPHTAVFATPAVQWPESGIELDNDGRPPLNQRTTGVQTLFTLIKAYVGTGILFLPRAFANGGAVFSTAVCCTIAVLATYCISLLIRARAAAADVGGVPAPSFAGIAKACYGTKAYAWVQISLLMTQIGTCCVYFIFISGCVQSLLEGVSKCADWATSLAIAVPIFITAAVMALPALLRHMKYLAPLAILADGCIVISLVYIFYLFGKRINNEDNVLALRGDQAPVDEERVTLTYFESKTVALFLGTAVFLFEGCPLALPVHQAMADQSLFMPLLSSVVGGCCLLFLSFALAGFMAYGDDVHQNIFTTLGAHDAWMQSVTVLYIIAVCCSFPLQAFPVYRIIETDALGWRAGEGKTDSMKKWKKNGLRCVVVMCLAGVASAGASALDNFVAVVGGVAMAPICFVFPPLFHYKLVSSRGDSTAEKVKDLVLTAIGSGLALFILVFSVYHWATADAEGKEACVPE